MICRFGCQLNRFSLNVLEGLLWFGHGQEYLFKCRLINGISTFYGFIIIFTRKLGYFWAKILYLNWNGPYWHDLLEFFKLLEYICKRSVTSSNKFDRTFSQISTDGPWLTSLLIFSSPSEDTCLGIYLS